MVKGITSSQKEFISRIFAGEKHYYNTYVFFADKTEIISNIKERYKRLLKRNIELCTTYFTDEHGNINASINYEYDSFVPVRDIGFMSDYDKNSIIDGYVTSYRKMIYDPRTMYLSKITIFKESLVGYYCVVTLCDAIFEVIDFDEFYNVLEIDEKYLIKNDNKFDKAISHYNSTFKFVDCHYEREEREENILYEQFVLNKDILRDFDQKAIKDVKVRHAILFGIWAMMLCKVFKQESIVVGELFAGNKKQSLSLYDLKKSNQISDMIEQVMHQNVMLDEISGFSIESINKAVGKNASDFAAVVLDLSYFQNTMVDISRIRNGGVDCYDTVASICPPLKISFKREKENILIQYAYDPRVFKNVNIESLHALFGALFSAILENKSDGILSKLEIDNNGGMNELRMIDIKRRIIKNCDVFMNLSPKEIIQLQEVSKICQYDIGRTIINPNVKTDEVMIIIVGRISEERQSKDGEIKPLLLLKEEDVFGIENAFYGMAANDMYTVESQQSLVLSIPVSKIIELANNNPLIYTNLLSVFSNRMEKFKRLWLMN